MFVSNCFKKLYGCKSLNKKQKTNTEICIYIIFYLYIDVITRIP